MNESQAVTYKTLMKDASYGEAGPDERTIAAYLDLFNRLKLTEDLCGWEPPMRSKARVRVRPKRYFCDPSLAAALLEATPERLLGDMQTLGMLFENLVLRDVRVFLPLTAVSTTVFIISEMRRALRSIWSLSTTGAGEPSRSS